LPEKSDTRRPFVGIMAKAPRPGHAKTRLTSALAPEVAADLYRHFLLDTVDVVLRVPDVTAALLCPAGDGADLARLDIGLAIVEQRESGLMQGLAFGVAYALAEGHGAVALINADSPTLPPARIAAAFAALATYDVVFGPTADGGYYLIAAAIPCDHLLLGAPYPDGATILRDTLDQAARLGLRAGTIAPWFDVDLPAELRGLAKALADAPPHLAAHTRRALAAHAAALQGL
jgi:glycosyltransferase A (GT-A) superfamily protein (DUF2064 family)